MLNRFFPTAASTYAGQVDALYFFLVAVSAFFTILIALLVVVFDAMRILTFPSTHAAPTACRAYFRPSTAVLP